MDYGRAPKIILAVIGIVLAGCSSKLEQQDNSQLSASQPASGEPDSKSAAGRGSGKLTEQSTLRNYLVYAALNNPGLEAAFNR